MLKYVPVEIPLALGVDTRADPRSLAQSGQVVANQDLSDWVLDKRGGLSTRKGTATRTLDVYGTATNLSDGRSLFAYNDQLLLANSNGLHRYASQEGVWASPETFFNWETTMTQRYAKREDNLNTHALRHAASATVNNITAVAWFNENDLEILLNVYDGDVPLVEELQIGTRGTTANNPIRVLVIGDDLFVLFTDNSGNTSCKIIDSTDVEGTIGDSPTTSSGTLIDAVVDDTQIVYIDSTIGINTISSSGTFGTRTTVDASATNQGAAGLAKNSDGSSFVVVYDKSDQVRWALVNSSMTVTGSGDVESSAGSAATGHITAIWSEDDSEFYVVWNREETSASPDEQYVWEAVHDSSGSQTTAPFEAAYNLQIQSHLFRFDDAECYLCSVAWRGPTTFYLVDRRTHKVVGRFLNFRGADYAETGVSVSKGEGFRPQVESDTVRFLLPEVVFDGTDATGGGLGGGTEILHQVTLSTDNPVAARTTFRNVLYASGPILWEVYGNKVQEQGILEPPKIVATAQSTASNSLTATATYTFWVTIDSINPDGSLTRAWGNTKSVTLTGGNDTITVDVAYVDALSHRDDFKVKLWCSVGNGSDLYLCDTNISTASSAGIITFTVGADPSTDNPQAPSFDEVFDDAAESSNFVAAGGERLWAVSSRLPSRLFFSKLVTDNGSVNFNGDLWVDLPESAKAIGYYGGTLMAFTATSVYVIPGRGPDNTGIGAFSVPIRVSGTAGISDARTLVETPVGLMWHGDGGFWLSNGGQPVFIGGAVTDYNTQTFTRGTVLPGTTRVRWITSSGRAVDFDWELRRWMTHTNLVGVDAANVGGTWNLLKSDGTVHYWDGSFTDDSTAVEPVVETATLVLNGVGGAKTIRRAGLFGKDAGSGHSIKVEASFDEAAYTTIGTFAASELPFLEFRMPTTRLLKTVKFKFTAVADMSPGEGFTLTSLYLEVGFTGGTGGQVVDQ